MLYLYIFFHYWIDHRILRTLWRPVQRFRCTQVTNHSFVKDSDTQLEGGFLYHLAPDILRIHQISSKPLGVFENQVLLNPLVYQFPDHQHHPMVYHTLSPRSALKWSFYEPIAYPMHPPSHCLWRKKVSWKRNALCNASGQCGRGSPMSGL